jgi:hypothetical protein
VALTTKGVFRFRDGVWIAIGLSLNGPGAGAQSARPVPNLPAANATERELLAVEQAWMVDAYLRHDAPALDRQLVPEFTLTFRDGRLYDRTHQLTALRSGPPEPANVAYRLEGQRPRVYGDAAVVTGRFISLQDGKPIAESRYTNTYVRQDGRWMVVASQITGVRRPER